LETHKEQPNSVLADADYFDLLKVSIEELIAYPENTAFHLSGGIDSSLLLHLAAEFEETLTAFTAYYSPDHADLKYSRLVAKETEANLLEVKIGDGQVLESSKHLRFISGGPVMAMGIPTFDIMSRTAKQHGITHLISGIGGDHLFTGHLKRAAIDKCGFFESIVNVDIQRVKWAFDPDVFEKIVSKLKEQVLAKVHQDLSIEEQVELFYREHFVKEHFRMSNIAHMKHGIVLSSPFWNLDLITLGLNRTTDRSDFSEKGFLRDELKKRKSIAAQRYHKQQMTLDLKHWQQAVRSELNSILTKNEPVIEGIRKEFIQELLAPNRPYNKSEFRLLWVLFNLYGWLKDLNINRFSLYEI